MWSLVGKRPEEVKCNSGKLTEAAAWLESETVPSGAVPERLIVSCFLSPPPREKSATNRQAIAPKTNASPIFLFFHSAASITCPNSEGVRWVSQLGHDWTFWPSSAPHRTHLIRPLQSWKGGSVMEGASRLSALANYIFHQL